MDKFWIAFSAIEQVDSSFVQRLYNYFGDIERAYNASKRDLEQIEGLSINKAEEFWESRAVYEEKIKRFTKKYANPMKPQIKFDRNNKLIRGRCTYRFINFQ